ncbi:MAG: ABC transporter permease [Rhodospirillaceae bacterium]|nr:ABC transporter permease [Rhodospirillaceae bacterium]
MNRTVGDEAATPAAVSPAEDERVFGGAHSRGLGPAWADVLEGVRRVDFWHRFAWNDVRARYRRSRIGEFWMVISIGIFILAVGVVYGLLFGLPLHTYLPYLSVGYVLWLLLSTLVLDGCQTFVSASAFLRQQRIPLSALSLRVVQRSFIVFAHNLVAIVVVFALFGVWPTWAALLAIPALALWWLNGVWISLSLGLVCARFRDVPQLVTSAIQILFLLTPVIWSPAASPEPLRAIVLLNPLAHFLSVVRDPLLGTTAPALSWIVVAGVTLVGWGATMLLLIANRARVPYWA